MRAVVTFLAVSVLVAGVSCGSKPSPPKPAATMTFPVVACSTLTDTEIVQLAKALPVFRSALRAANWSPTPPKQGGSATSALESLVEGMNVAGVDDSLKRVGSDWGTVRRTLYKVFAASAALSVQRVNPEQAELLKKDTSQAGKRMYESFVAMKGACAAVPAANLEVLNNHRPELASLDSLGR